MWALGPKFLGLNSGSSISKLCDFEYYLTSCSFRPPWWLRQQSLPAMWETWVQSLAWGGTYLNVRFGASEGAEYLASCSCNLNSKRCFFMWVLKEGKPYVYPKNFIFMNVWTYPSECQYPTAYFLLGVDQNALWVKIFSFNICFQHLNKTSMLTLLSIQDSVKNTECLHHHLSKIPQTHVH